VKRAAIAVGMIAAMLLPLELHSQTVDALQQALVACVLDAAQQEGGSQKQLGLLELSCSGAPAKVFYDIIGAKPERIERRESHDGAIHNTRYMKPVPPGGVAHPVQHCFERGDKNMGGIDYFYGCNLYWNSAPSYVSLRLGICALSSRVPLLCHVIRAMPPGRTRNPNHPDRAVF
jgi:hypothetical protein